MQRRSFLLAGTAAWCMAAVPLKAQAQSQAQQQPAADSGIVVVGHAGLPRIDVALVQRLYTGRAIEAGGQLATVLNLRSGHPLRQRFLASFLQTDEERYRAYWTVRRHVGKGAPPREVDSVVALLEFVARTPGAMGYADVKDLPAGSNLICRL